jgi:two-component system chemotaxis response regulator CheB
VTGFATRPAAAPAAASSADGRIRVLVCDDSLTVRGALCRIVETDPQLLLVGRAGDGAEAVREVGRLRPDVLVLDVEMPVMDGLSALPALLRADPGLKVLMASTLTTRGADIALRALRAGAADYVPKPTSAGAIGGAGGFREEFLAKLRALGALRRRPATAGRTAVPLRLAAAPPAAARPRLLAVGASTGGPQALFALFGALPKTFPLPIVLTQHMPKTFTAILADHITRLGGIACAEAQDGDALRPGLALLAPGDRHLLIEARGEALVARLSDAPAENFCRPAVDPMLRSASAATAGRTLAVILTGMGQDGLAGSRVLVAAGGQVLAQDEATSVVWGMPGAVAQAGLARAVLPVAGLALRIVEAAGGPAAAVMRSRA